MKNKLEDLRNHLFSALEALGDPEKPMDLERARTIAEVAQVVINSARVEVDFLRHYGNVRGTDFVPVESISPAERRPRPALRA